MQLFYFGEKIQLIPMVFPRISMLNYGISTNSMMYFPVSKRRTKMAKMETHATERELSFNSSSEQ